MVTFIAEDYTVNHLGVSELPPIKEVMGGQRFCLPFGMGSAMVCGMTIRMDKSGRIVLPKVIRERFGLIPDRELDIVEQPDGVLIRRREEIPAMVKIDGLWVHQGTPDAGAQWDRVIDEVREERAQSVFMT